MAYTPGVARVCRSIHEDPQATFALTMRRNMVAVVTDGSAVLGLGNIGPQAALPVMEGKAVLFKEFGGVDAFPICLDTQDTDKIVETCRFLAPTFGGINLEDISSPRCVEIEERLISLLDIPVFHDDQHGTAIVVLAALHNALKVVGKSPGEIRVTLNGAGAAGMAITKLIRSAGVEQIVVCDREGAIYQGRTTRMNPVKQWLAEVTNHQRLTGSLGDVIAGSDVFIGVSGADVLTVDDLKTMAHEPVVFAMANPEPEIDPELALPFAGVVATGRSDYPNQINNVLCFPGLFRGMLDVRAGRVTETMKIAAAEAIAGVIAEEELLPDYIVPSVFDRRVASRVAQAVSQAAVEDGVAHRQQKPGYKVIKKGQFAYSAMQVGRDETIRLALYTHNEPAIISPAYLVIESKDETELIPEYMMMWFQRPESDRYGWFISDSSVRASLEWERFSDIEIPIPNIDEQKKYVALYKGLLKNQKVYENSLDDLQLICDSYMDTLKEKDLQPIRNSVELVDNRNSDGSNTNLLGINVKKVFMPSKAKTTKANLVKYKIINKGQFAYSAMQVGRDETVRVVLYSSDEPVIISPAYSIFQVKKDAKILPEFLMLWFYRLEFNRYGWFISDSSVRAS